MKITVKSGDVKIVVNEVATTYQSSIKYQADNDLIIKTIKLMSEECIKLIKTKQ